ncbi:MAG: hypothetical protein NWQ40_00440, partial [Schleiferiaceae bacterium]|nr:hypothetical protein [Schleiferiaceae bacterium]
MSFCSKSFTKALTALVLTLASLGLAAQTGGLRGLVVDQADQSPLNLAKVSLTFSGKSQES